LISTSPFSLSFSNSFCYSAQITTGLTSGAIVGIVIAAVIVVLAATFLTVFRRKIFPYYNRQADGFGQQQRRTDAETDVPATAEWKAPTTPKLTNTKSFKSRNPMVT